MKIFIIATIMAAGLLNAQMVRDNAKEVVYDNVKGLTWQDNAVVETQTMDWGDAAAYCQDLDHAGAEDWRLPRLEELMDLIDRDNVEVNINPAFEYTSKVNGLVYWSSTIDPDDFSGAYGVSYVAATDLYQEFDQLENVRCVRAGELDGTENENPKGSRRDAQNEIVYDAETGLTWQDNAIAASQTRSWDQAVSYCLGLDFAGSTNWRLPTLDELTSIRDFNNQSIHIDPLFVNTAVEGYWSSTVDSEDPSGAYGMNYHYGVDFWAEKTQPYYVRCVTEDTLVKAIPNMVPVYYLMGIF